MDDKLTGSFYTPIELIEYMVGYVQDKTVSQGILKPSAGDGRFIPFLSIFNCSTLTTAAYPGNPAYFNGSILKDEITDTPEVVIKRIADCVDNYNVELWLTKQHQALVSEYQKLLKDVDFADQQELSSIEKLLDRFEKILDSRQEERIKKSLIYERETDEFIKRQKENEEKLSELHLRLNRYLEEIENS